VTRTAGEALRAFFGTGYIMSKQKDVPAQNGSPSAEPRRSAFLVPALARYIGGSGLLSGHHRTDFQDRKLGLFAAADRYTYPACLGFAVLAGA